LHRRWSDQEGQNLLLLVGRVEPRAPWPGSAGVDSDAGGDWRQFHRYCWLPARFWPAAGPERPTHRTSIPSQHHSLCSTQPPRPGGGEWCSQCRQMLGATSPTPLGSTKRNDFAFSCSANRINITQAGDNPKLQQQIVSAMPLIFPSSGKLHPTPLPEQICWCSTYLGTIGPWGNRQDLFACKDDCSISIKRHTFKMCVLYDQNAKDEEQGDEAGGMWGARSEEHTSELQSQDHLV